ncbi:MAG: hypothetical protein OXL34_06935 [Gemmatimonadota bacterium]|nr:hypothetical protein [Gemmatimonadota bacterium]
MIVVLVLLIPILAIVLDSDVGKAIARRLERGKRARDDSGAHDRLVYLESELERLGKEVGRLEEESRFLHRLLAEHTDPDALPPSGGARTSDPES